MADAAAITAVLQNYYLALLPFRGLGVNKDPCWAAETTNTPLGCTAASRAQLVKQLGDEVVRGGTLARQTLAATGLPIAGLVDWSERVQRAWADLIAAHHQLAFDGTDGRDIAARLGQMGTRATEPATAQAALNALHRGTTSRTPTATVIAVRKAAIAIGDAVWDKPWSAINRMGIRGLAEWVATRALEEQRDDPHGTPPGPEPVPPSPRPARWPWLVGGVVVLGLVLVASRR